MIWAASGFQSAGGDQSITGIETGRFDFWWTCRAGSMYDSGGYALDAAPALFGIEIGGVCGP
jgi:hypothetical protein